MPISNALRYGLCVTKYLIVLMPPTNHTCLYSSAAQDATVFGWYPLLHTDRGMASLVVNKNNKIEILNQDYWLH